MSKISIILKLFIILAIIISCCSNSFAKSTIEEIGDFTQIIVPAYAFMMAMNEKDWEGVKQFGYSFTAMQISVIGLKSAIDAERPNCSDNNSFPSGHTASAFSGATFIHKRYGIKRAIIPYLLAGFTGYSRIYAEKHNFCDVAAGAVISSLFTWLFVSEYDGVQVSVSPQSVRLGFWRDFGEVQMSVNPESIKLEVRITF